MEREGTTTGIHHPVLPEHAAPVGPYKPLLRVSNVVIGALTLNVVFDLAAAIVDFQMLGLLERARDGDVVTFEEAEAHDSRMQAVGMLQLFAVIGAGIPFIFWLRRAYRNLGALGVRRLRIRPGWAVGAWFVPILNAIRPKSIVNDVWRASDPALPRDLAMPPDGAPVAPVINWWWAAFLVSGWFIALGTNDVLDPSLDEVISSVRLFLAADALSVVAGILAIVVVRKVSLRQEQRRAVLVRAAQQVQTGAAG
ncbi:MAG TPA: DUF4328 domain-containing protein [Actinomycetota bacterium]|nr:DUF4328 domain-containing protein [Actinomycetota bacterium]